MKIEHDERGYVIITLSHEEQASLRDILETGMDQTVFDNPEEQSFLDELWTVL